MTAWNVRLLHHLISYHKDLATRPISLKRRLLFAMTCYNFEPDVICHIHNIDVEAV